MLLNLIVKDDFLFHVNVAVCIMGTFVLFISLVCLAVSGYTQDVKSAKEIAVPLGLSLLVSSLGFFGIVVLLIIFSIYVGKGIALWFRQS